MTEDVGDAGSVADEQFHLQLYNTRTPAWLRPIRNRVCELPGGLLMWRALTGFVGAAIVLLGVALVPLPGPGWAIVFLGIAVWATEFNWARRLLYWGRSLLRRWTAWTMAQSAFVKLLIGLVGMLFVGGFVWLAIALL